MTVLLLAACGGGSGASSDAATSDGAPRDAPAPDAPSAHAGAVPILQLQGVLAAASAQFVAGANTSATNLGTVGPCVATRTDAGVTLTYISAGSITLTGLASAVTLTPSGTKPNVSYYSQLPMPPFTAGATVTATAPGAEFPAFSVSAMAPANVAGFTAPTSISRAADVTVTWTAGSGPHLRIAIANSGGGMNSRLVCDVPDTGTYAIPAAALALLPASATMVSMNVLRYDHAVSSSDVELLVGTMAGDLGETITFGN